MQNPPSRRAWLIPGLVAAILFVGAVASNLIASDLETTLKPYRRWVWLMFAIALVVAVATAIVDARRRDRLPVSNAAAETTRIVNAGGERSVASDEVVGKEHIAFRVRKKIFAYYLFDHHGDGKIAFCCKSSLNEQTSIGESRSREFLCAGLSWLQRMGCHSPRSQ